MMWNGDMDWSWIGFGIVHILLFWTLVVIGIIAIATWLGGGRTRSSPLDILKARYAKGEVTRDEFERLRRELAA